MPMGRAIDANEDPAGATARKEITSTSPFARVDLCKNSFVAKTATDGHIQYTIRWYLGL